MYCYFCKREYKNYSRHEKTTIHKASKTLYPNNGHCFICSEEVDQDNEVYAGSSDGEGYIFCYDIQKHFESIQHLEKWKYNINSY